MATYWMHSAAISPSSLWPAAPTLRGSPSSISSAPGSRASRKRRLPFRARCDRDSALDPNVFGEKINERAHTRRQGSATSQEHRVNVFPVTRVEFLEHRHEPAGLD